MAQAGNSELVDSFEQFFRNYYDNEIKQLAQRYPNEQRSLHIDWQELYRYDPDLADDFLAQPEQLQRYAEEALRLYDLPIDVSLGQAHVRIRNLPETESPEIREIRARDMNTLVEVRGIVRKATDVRPKIEEAAFECQLCGTLSRVPQSSGDFQEPHECQGCERQGPFRVNFDQSEFVDSQKLRIQESPEGLRGGETPQSLDVHVEDDITGEVTPGDHVSATGVLRLEQQGDQQEKSPVFDFYMEGMSVDIDEEQFEDMDITDEDKKAIYDISNQDDVYEQMVASIAPSIYGYEQEKLAMILQLFSGVTKQLPDGSRIRGDLHMLLIGDPGTGKCLKHDTKVTLGDGSEQKIGKLVEENLDEPIPVDDGFYQEVDLNVPTVLADGSISPGRATKVWKRESPEKMYRIQTASGSEIEVTPSHPLFVQEQGALSARQASDLKEGDFIASSRNVQTISDNPLSVQFERIDANNANSIDLPDKLTPELTRLLGLVIGEGYVTYTDTSATVSITNADQELIETAAEGFESLDLRYSIRDHHTRDGVQIVQCHSRELVRFLESLEPAILENSNEQRVPTAIKRATPSLQSEFVKAYVDGEGHVSTDQREIEIASMSEQLLEDLQSLLRSFGIVGRLEERDNESYRLRLSGDDFRAYIDQIGFITPRKREASQAFKKIPTNTNTDIIPNVGGLLKEIREKLALSQFDCGIPRTTYQHYERGDRNPSQKSLQLVLNAFEQRADEIRQIKERVEEGSWDAITTARDEFDISQSALAGEMSVTQTAVSYYEREQVLPDGGDITSAKSLVLDRIDTALDAREDIVRLKQLLDNDIWWDPIVSIEVVEPDYDWVYDLEIEGTHNYVSNGVISHNSQMLSYIQNIAPRAVYTSGKGSSSAGLTAAAVRDDFGDGQQWTLEAGALVLADQGIAAIDELDKMRAEDRSAMHEALEQQKISVSKAGINATLKSRCSLLGAANPKYGRFDQYEPIGEQIDLEPALISRFDLIFTVTDQPDEEKDRNLAEHIITTNYAGELTTQREEMTSLDVSAEEIDEMTEQVDPAIDAELLRKYIAYAKQNCHPRMTEAARNAIRDFYVDLRAKGTDEDAPVPVTARKLEALVRLSEASARVRLSDTVEESDANRVIEIVRSCLQDIGVDPETGEFDADIVEAGTSKSQRDRIKNLKQLISDIEEEYDDGAPVDIVMERAEEVGMDQSKAEHEIEKLKQKGEVYEPSTDTLRTT
ncbi:helix-turn-helix domain-containing protein [Haloterrigena sp. SYSU A121-1]|uniref:DNA helicase n=1 Tax=Haloterrigena gelatinilytica TaxID=2741724 RepID=A0A8J8GIT9_9EURY|nr:LAGLIDADG family homing endonuclease [Haloterrigena gelatinilytica]NUB90441.1 helix-turn-helix domain-containing protein [Haloterrigena gelatinilytica]